jgi:hypothetical protein
MAKDRSVVRRTMEGARGWVAVGGVGRVVGGDRAATAGASAPSRRGGHPDSQGTHVAQTLPSRCLGGPEGRPRRERFRATMRFAGMGDARLELATPSLSSWFGADDARQQSTPNACKRGACRLPQGDCLAWFRNPISGRLCRECAARSLVLTVRARTRLARRPP